MSYSRVRLSHRYMNAKGRRTSGRFIALPYRMMMHANFIGLSGGAIKLLLDVSTQFRGHNNGDLSVTLTVMRRRGWRSNSLLRKALAELLEAGFLLQTQQGGRYHPNLFALTWQAIDECGGKHGLSPTRVAGNDWEKAKTMPRRSRRSVPPRSRWKKKPPGR